MKANREPMAGKAKMRNPMKSVKRLLGYIFENYKIHCFVVLACILISSIASVIGTMFLKNLIDDYILPFINQKEVNFTPLLMMLMKMAVVYYVGVLATWTFSRIMVNVSQGTLKRIRDDLFEHMETLPIKYFDTHAHGDIMSVYTNDTDTLRQMISQSLPQLLSSIITVVSVLVSMIILNIPLTIITLIMVSLMMFVTKKIAGKSSEYFMAQQKNIGALNGYIEEMIEGQKVVKVFCHEHKSIEDFNRLNEGLNDSANNANKFANILMPIMNNMGHLSYVITAMVGSLLAILGVGNFTLGGLASFLQFNKSFNQPISQISMQLNSVIMALAGAERIFELLDEKSEEDDGYVELVNAKIDEDGTITEVKERTGIWAWRHYHKDEGTTTYTKLEGHVEFDGVDFGYNYEKIILHDIVINARPGEKIAFVGATGAGKTTITNLINRFYDIQDGKIRYDGININKIKKNDLRRSLGIVLQDTHLFTGTVMENIRYGKLDATDEEVIAAAKLANADHFIDHLPNGYDTILTGDGGNLSQGQRQLLAIARAAVANPPVLILDEATSSIDTRTEKIVQEGMDKLMEGRTVFVIAHRLSTIKNSDVIMVLDQGRIIERGNHDRLIDKKGVYYELYTGLLEQS
ncbi:ABC transporter ATP-binding protein [Romboutsia hominis]|uniref:ABC transporter ATP-binding protein n=1 Tax=Romboutsia hominis TaxID=1507512 RepID=UPI001F06CEC1|nr:ABC transporter ATP-binding protein [Romboutsia hominis]MCH1959876.1 ABC transporter ATP-binding protein/permease [Romboutsia hominis]MCH1969701.1 ABC transporter ATP-binding protein/permease [Romboutsia hominis]